MAKRPPRTNRNQQLKENYKRLRDAGFSSKEATRFRGASEEAIKQAITNKNLPEIQTKKQTAKLIKQVKLKEYKSTEEVNIQLNRLTQGTFKRIFKEMKQWREHEYRYYYVFIRFHFSDKTFKEVQTRMKPIDKLESYTELEQIVEQAIDNMMSKAYISENEIVKTEVHIRLWRIKPKE